MIKRKVYGPPGYGQTPAQDAHETILILSWHNLYQSYPLNAEMNDSPNLDPAKNVRKVQLFMNRLQAADARRHLDRMVTATGMLNESITASQRTKVWLDGKNLKSPWYLVKFAIAADSAEIRRMPHTMR